MRYKHPGLFLKPYFNDNHEICYSNYNKIYNYFILLIYNKIDIFYIVKNFKIWTLKWDNEIKSTLGISNTGEYILILLKFRFFLLFKIKSLKIIWKINLKNLSCECYQFNYNDSYLITVINKKTMIVWHLKIGYIYCTLFSKVYIKQIMFLKNNNTLITINYKSIINVWDINKKTVLIEIKIDGIIKAGYSSLNNKLIIQKKKNIILILNAIKFLFLFICFLKKNVKNFWIFDNDHINSTKQKENNIFILCMYNFSIIILKLKSYAIFKKRLKHIKSI
ncbi:hypothetical protein M951_chr380 (nucleomorph) [Lotharella oceanica]|uniref:Uncharacterized protein n=2 Tax=Lotharella oceanica TaxID=641309 RepID=A0A060DHJ0_9EUKA|nr:hypothetical protein M951_chr380 [Lotharella oceanica]